MFILRTRFSNTSDPFRIKSIENKQQVKLLRKLYKKVEERKKRCEFQEIKIHSSVSIYAQ